MSRIGNLLGWPLDRAMDALRAQGIEPEVSRILAPRRDAGQGMWRVVRVRENGAHIDACAFVTTVRQEPNGNEC